MDTAKPTPEGDLIRQARDLAIPKLSIRAAASRAGMSPEQWGNIERGYRYTRPGDPPRRFDAPAATIAKMANVLGIAPAELTAAGREDAARVLESALRREGVIVPAPRPAPVRPVLDFSRTEAALRPFIVTVLGQIYERIGFPPGSGPGRDLPEPPEDAGRLPGPFLFSEERESGVWDDPRILTVGEKIRTIALMRKISAEWGEGRRRTGLERPGGTAARLFRVARRAGSTPH